MYIEFNGDVSKECKNVFLKRFNRDNVWLSLTTGMVVGVPALIVYLCERRLWFFLLFSCGVFILTFLMTFPFINPQKKNLESNLPTRIEITDGIIIKDGNGESNHAEREICFVKKVVDEGDWYNIIFYFPHKLSCCICQKNLLVKGTIEEFEEFFEGKIVRKIKKTK